MNLEGAKVAKKNGEVNHRDTEAQRRQKGLRVET